MRLTASFLVGLAVKIQIDFFALQCAPMQSCAFRPICPSIAFLSRRALASPCAI